MGSADRAYLAGLCDERSLGHARNHAARHVLPSQRTSRPCRRSRRRHRLRSRRNHSTPAPHQAGHEFSHALRLHQLRIFRGGIRCGEGCAKILGGRVRRASLSAAGDDERQFAARRFHRAKKSRLRPCAARRPLGGRSRAAQRRRAGAGGRRIGVGARHGDMGARATPRRRLRRPRNRQAGGARRNAFPPNRHRPGA